MEGIGMTNTCIIGISGFGAMHYRTLVGEIKEGHTNLIGATVINPDEEAKKCAYLREAGCTIYDDYTRMLTDLSGKADLCIIPTGIPWHKVMTIDALSAGMHVLVEKPAAGCIQDVHLMKQASQKTGKGVAVGYQHMYAESALETKHAILKGTVGDVRMIKCLGLWPRSHSYFNRNNWAGRLQIADTWVLDSPVNNALSHYLMMMLFLAGPSERTAATPVFVEAELYRVNEIETFDTACMRIQTETGIPVLFYVTHACNETENPEIQIHGSKGTILWKYGNSVVESESGSKQDLSTPGLDDIRQRIMQATYAMVKEEEGFYCDLELASKPLIVVNAIHEACEIHTLNDHSVQVQESDLRSVIPGIEGIILSAFAEEKLFHEMGVSWALPKGSLDCTDYQVFKG
jgi:predicted dehydrogenase